MEKTLLHKRLDRARKHQLMTQELAKSIPRLYSQENNSDPTVVVKFFSPFSSFTWYITEYDGEDTMFGLVKNGADSELGYVSLQELGELHRKGLPLVERDLYWNPTPLSTVK